MKVAFIGLGVMGYPMAGHLKNAGLDVCVYNRTEAKASQWCVEHGGNSAPTPREAAENCDIVFTCVGNDDDVRQVIFGDDAAFAGMKPGAILVDHTTASASLARELDAAAREQGFSFLDAPVSGGQAGAENAALTVMIGGDQSTYDAANPAMDAYSKFTKLLGPAGSGQLAKMVNQVCIAGVVQGLAEGLNFAKNAGLDGEALIETISKGAAGSWQMENRYATMLADEYEFGFAVDWMRKDLGIAIEEARNNGSELPVAQLVDSFYEDIQKMGGGRWDTSSLLARLVRK
ncbi:MAG: NAD(P)-dependent oxidoreductase [Gammaproteobacteria bacterium]|jgi:3-hydroxyisobutyrate dehydrogenase-like beta-hydroxyacid dehydrogenase|nr:NAD(P)-dependent oxidoreductase [Gammaproteobacteria bacterium]MBT3859834.1 NAD(P)-dependent oxidoreductase [Gammaproteobacteria bacterium]MBT3988512.1 NAD(P)-dependent oxidoreductase [Gammaproteobacteria bacterium]MBT4256601.1 NAD(P)-dependent oxidoreductase [Gammaproteobacteria bacterium]MBT4583182.1 NAD(P)-dependent oxidoreductase [Gammaproteobacteria bacterium]